MRRVRWLLLAAMAVATAGGRAQQPASTNSGQEAEDDKGTPGQTAVTIRENEFMLPYSQAFPLGLDALEVYAETPGRHPLAVLTHGASPKEEERRTVTPWGQLGQAMWFARRGYVAIVVVRRGYGRSGGQQDSTLGGCNSRSGDFKRVGEASADDLRAVIKYAAGLPEVDANTVVSVGVSAGGFAQVALSADPPAGLKAAISFAGGRGADGHEHNCDLGMLIDAFGSFGKRARKHGPLPMLWIYSENDHWFTPDMARKFDAAYSKEGGADQLVMAPPDGEDGHHLYSHPAVWSDTVQGFLKAHNLLPLGDVVLPAPTPPETPPPAGLSDKGLAAWKRFLSGGPFKAFATNGSGAFGYSTAGFEQAIANEKAMDSCKKAAAGNGSCSVVATSTGKK
jgi:dienelactone hydrolase